MTTVTWRSGSAAPLVVVPYAPDNTEINTTGLDLQIRIEVNGACVALDGVPEGGGYLFDLSALDLAPRAWRASFRYRAAPEGWSHAEDFVLQIEGGC